MRKNLVFLEDVGGKCQEMMETQIAESLECQAKDFEEDVSKCAEQRKAMVSSPPGRCGGPLQKCWER